MQNLPTMITIFAEEYEMAALEGHNTEAKELKKKLDDLRDSKNFVLVLGVLQLLEIYASVSLDAQHMKYFPTQVWTSIKRAQEKVKSQSETWVWSEDRLKFSVMEAPKTIVERLVMESRYEPKLLEKNVRRKGKELRESGLLEEGAKIDSLFVDEEQVKILAGEAYMNEISMEDVEVVVTKLSKFAKDIYETWEKRHIQTELEKAASDVLGLEVFQPNQVDFIPHRVGGGHQVGPLGGEQQSESQLGGDQQEEQVGGGEQQVVRDRSDLMKKLEILISKLSQYQRDQFDAVEIFPGLISWINYFNNKATEKPQNEIYSDWYRRNVQSPSSPECNSKFARLFQNLQI